VKDLFIGGVTKMNLNLHKLKSSVQLTFVLLLGLTTISLFAQDQQGLTPEERGYVYEERVSLGLIYENSLIQKQMLSYKVRGNFFDIEGDTWPLFGIGGHLPFTNWIGLNGIVGYQRSTFEFSNDDPVLETTLLSSPFSTFTAKDFEGKIISNNLIVQAGFELGLPLWTSYQEQGLFKILAYGSGIGGKTFYDDSKFQNSNIFGFAYGGGIRYASGKWSFSAGARGSFVYWESNYFPEYASENTDDDRFIVEYQSFASPFVKIAVSLY